MIQHTEQTGFDTTILNNPEWCRALTLTERLELVRMHGNMNELSKAHNADFAARKLKRWKEQYPFDKEGYFAERLEMDGLDVEDLCMLLGEAPATFQSLLSEKPAWLQELALAYAQEPSQEYEKLLLRMQRPEKTSEADSSNAPEQLGFLTAVLPLIARGINRLRAGIVKLAATYHELPFDPETVQTVFLEFLPSRLMDRLARTFTLELNVARLEGRLSGATPQERLRDFVSQLRQREVVLPLLEEYAPLARCLMITIENWVGYGLEFLNHLCADWPVLRQTFCADSEPGLLSKMNGDAGDLHKGGRSTLVLRFSSGFQLIYRPKPMAVDVHFQELLRWLNQRGDHPAFRVLTVIDRGPYGWAEFVDARECLSQEELARFYERQGGYLALLYALEATDVHFENLIASGEHPVMIDLESLFHPRTEMLTPLLSQRQTTTMMNHSVLRIGLLPHRMWGNQEHIGLDISGLSGQGGQLTPHPVLRVDMPGTDEMHFIRKHVEMSAQQNRPSLNGQSADVQDYRSHLLKGFEQIYRLLMRERASLMSGPIQAFAHDEIRMIARATNAYAQLLRESYHPDLLRNSMDRDRFFDRLWGATEQQPKLKRLIEAERADLHADDIPIFTSRPDTRDIFSARGICIPDYLEERSLDAVERRLQSFDETDLTRQIWFIEASLATLTLSEGILNWKPSHLVPEETLASRAQLLQAACKVGDRLADLALVSEHGAGWIGLTYVNEREWRLMPTSADLYNGTTGIALFLAYLGSITGVARYTDLARAALLSVQEQEQELRKQVQDINIGGFDGWGGLIFLYTHLGVLWQDTTLLVRATEIAHLLPELIGKDKIADIMAGAAGALSALLALYSVTPSAELLEIALQCGDHLLQHAAQCGGEPLMNEDGQSPIPCSRPLAGFSHGAAGMALSLLRLAGVSQEERFRQGAQRAMEYERSIFSTARKNWPDFRSIGIAEARRIQLPEGEELCMTTWCHGAPGVGLGRLASLPYQDDAFMREEIEIAIQTTLEQGFGINHSLCHGDLGNLELLLSAEQILGEPRYRELAQTYTAMLLKSVEREGWLTGIPLGVESPGLMTGIAGIGYQFLRLAAPQQVPIVLTLDSPIRSEIR